jgi:hypothetical protein
MRNSIIGVAVAAIILSCAGGEAGAVTLGFDDLTVGALPGVYGGLVWTNPEEHGIVDGSNYYTFPNAFQNGTITSPNVMYSTGTLTVTKEGAGSFNFDSTYLMSAWQDGMTLEFSASLAGAQKYLADFTAPGPAGPPLLETFNWQDIDTLKITTLVPGVDNPGFNGFGSFVVIDNFSYQSAAAVPEPSSLLLVAAGLAGLFLLRRKIAAPPLPLVS